MMIQLRFDVKSIRKPTLARTIIETGVLLNIIKAGVEARRGEIIIEVDDKRAEEVMRKFREYGVDTSKIERVVEKDDELCVHCGACLSVCPVEVFTMSEERKVAAEPKKCTRCGVCIDVCPFSALSLPG